MASELVHEFTDESFKTDVLNSSEPVLVDFWAEWCMPCRMLAPTIEEIAGAGKADELLLDLAAMEDDDGGDGADLVFHRGVASLVGIDNLLFLEVVGHDEIGGASLLRLESEKLAVPLCDAQPGTSIGVGFYADDVLLCLERPAGISARNALECVVVSLHELGHDVLVELELGAQRLRARLTPGAVSELELKPGDRVVALIKSSAVHLLG